MPSHQITGTTLKPVAPEALVSMNSNELIDLWKEQKGLDLWGEIADAYMAVKNNSKVSAIDKFEAAVKLGELALRIKRAGKNEKAGAVTVQVVSVDATSKQ